MKLFFNSKLILKRFSDHKVLTKRYINSVNIGSTARLTKTFTEEDVKTFAKLSGDLNPLHFDHKFCSETKFGKPIVHGMLTNGLVSAVLGTVLPGPGAVIVDMTMNFTEPLYIGEEVTAEVTVDEIRKKVIRLKYLCFTTEGKKVLNGRTTLIVV